MKKNKFRAWDKELNTMVYSDMHNKKEYQVEYDFTFNENGEPVCWWNEDYDDNCGYPTSNDGYLDNIMEYTSLNDRVNNKEIYECDILKALNRVYDCEDNWRDYFQTFEVTYLNGCWMFDNYNAHEFFNRYMYIEVIGNKFEGINEEN